jgi:hypothetical protein
VSAFRLGCLVGGAGGLVLGAFAAVAHRAWRDYVATRRLLPKLLRDALTSTRKAVLIGLVIGAVLFVLFQ